jgi:hypothetical protein
MDLGDRKAFRPVKSKDDTFLHKLKKFIEDEEMKEEGLL